MEESVLLIDKPKGISSFDVIRELRKKLGMKKIGHAGTLDPLASGLMILGVGEGTKKLTDYIKLPKEYVADILIGERRSTGDMEGEVVEECSVPEISRSKISGVLHSMLGMLTLPVPAYSAIKKGGMPLYKKARKAEKEGKTIEDVPIRNMKVNAAKLLELRYSTIDRTKRLIVRVLFAVESGVYIRSLAEEFGKRLGYPATLADLRRTKIGEFDIKDAEKL